MRASHISGVQTNQLVSHCLTDSPLFFQRPMQWSSHPRQFQSNSWNCYRSLKDTQTDWNSAAWRDFNLIQVSPRGPIKLLPSDSVISVLNCIFQPPSSPNRTYLMPVCIIPRLTMPRQQSKVICQPLGAVKSQWACHHQTTPPCQNSIQVWL